MKYKFGIPHKVCVEYTDCIKSTVHKFCVENFTQKNCVCSLAQGPRVPFFCLNY
jgi:hypothetical protein